MKTSIEQVREKIAREASLPPGQRTQMVPCAFCERGGNGNKSCGSGWKETRFSKFKGCFAGKLLPEGGFK